MPPWYVRCKPCTYLASRLAPLGESKTISDPMGRLAQPVHLSCKDTNTVSKQTKTRFHMTLVTKEFNRVCQKRFLSLRYVSLKSCTYLVSRFATSKRTKTSFHLSLVTTEYHWVRPKRYLSLWYVWRKPCTYLALTLTLSINGPK